MKVETEFHTVDTRSPEENIIRGLFAFFLNKGTVDELIQSQDGKLKFGSNSTSDVGLAVWNATKKVIVVEFLEWADSDDLASYLCAGSVGDALKERLKAKGYNEFPTCEPFSAMVGQRFKDLTDFDRKHMPKDIRKSFETKVVNAIPKFIKEYGENPRACNSNNLSGFTMDEWFERALDAKNREYLPYKSLRNIHNLLAKCVRIGENMAPSIQRARDELAVARVMLS